MPRRFHCVTLKLNARAQVMGPMIYVLEKLIVYLAGNFVSDKYLDFFRYVHEWDLWHFFILRKSRWMWS